MEAKRSLLHVNAQLFLPALDAVTERHYRMITERRATATTLAIRPFAADHDGRLPDRLEDPLAAYLPKVPIDPFTSTAGAIRYLAGGEPILYSVNSNGIDDAGSKADRRGLPAKGIWDGLDAVFHLTRQPRPAEEEEEDEPGPDLPPDLNGFALRSRPLIDQVEVNPGVGSGGHDSAC